MVERHVVIPVAPHALWDALTQPEQLRAWFGYQVEWNLTPGGSARWTRPGGSDTRHGVVDDVAPGHRLAYRWWPESGDGPASSVTYDLASPDDDPSATETRLTVRETAIPRPEEADRPDEADRLEIADRLEEADWAAGSHRPEEADSSPMACALTDDRPLADGWSEWDTRHAGLWLRLHTTWLVTV